MGRFEEAKKLVGTAEVGSDGVEVECRFDDFYKDVRWVIARNGMVHRTDGKPALITEDGNEFFCENGRRIFGDKPASRGEDGVLTYREEGFVERVFDSSGNLTFFGFGSVDIYIFGEKIQIKESK